jgi:hypothetical protein
VGPGVRRCRRCGDLVGFCELLEALFGTLIVGVDVRVMIAGETAVGLLDLRLGGSSGHAQDLVVVALGRQL